jgi:hypothetical protein
MSAENESPLGSATSTAWPESSRNLEAAVLLLIDLYCSVCACVESRSLPQLQQGSRAEGRLLTDSHYLYKWREALRHNIASGTRYSHAWPTVPAAEHRSRETRVGWNEEEQV